MVWVKATGRARGSVKVQGDLVLGGGLGGGLRFICRYRETCSLDNTFTTVCTTVLLYTCSPVWSQLGMVASKYAVGRELTVFLRQVSECVGQAQS